MRATIFWAVVSTSVRSANAASTYFESGGGYLTVYGDCDDAVSWMNTKTPQGTPAITCEAAGADFSAEAGADA